MAKVLMFRNSPTLAVKSTIRLTTYNIHKCKGIDGQTRPERIAEVLQEIDADLIALQEVLNGTNGELPHQAGIIAGLLQMNYVMGSNVIGQRHEYGNIILTRLPIKEYFNHNISVANREPRGCLRADVMIDKKILHVFNTHFGLGYQERARQAETIFESGIMTDIAGPRVLLGDFNDWFPGRASRYLRNRLHDPSRGLRGWGKRTHPCLLPIFKLDKIFLEPSLKVDRSYVHRSRLARIASDHLPLVAQIEL